MRSRSRLSRRLEQQTKKTFILSILGIIVILIFLVKFGLPILINFSLFIADYKSTKDYQKKNTLDFIQPPILNPTYQATNSAQITISGYASFKQTVNLYINDKLVDSTNIKKDNSFRFENITLFLGENVVKAKTITSDNKESEFSNQLTITYKKDPPSLSLTSPSNDQSFSKEENPITVSGKTDTGVKVTVNSFWAIVDGQGSFSYNLRLQNEDNTIKIIATDEAGNKAEMERKVKYSP